MATGLVVSFLSCGVGIWMAVGHTAEDLDKFAFALLSMLGSWVSGIGALSAAVVALYVVTVQIRDAKVQDAVRCIHHAMATTNDLRARLHSLKTTVVEGGRPLAALTRNVESMLRRYEALYDRDLYRHLPGPVIDRITSMSGSFAGIEMLAVAISSGLNNQQHAVLVVNHPVDPKVVDSFSLLQNDLDELFSALQVERSKLD